MEIIELKTGQQIAYRPNTTDLNCIKEVIGGVYKLRKIDFDVKSGEHWLDLGGCIGAFGVYCNINGANCESYEPVEENYELMQFNYETMGKGNKSFNSAVSNQRKNQLVFYSGKKQSDEYRYSFIENKRSSKKIQCNNLHADSVFVKHWDGVKMDIEGSELGLIDDHLIPDCDKLVMEYHFSKDKSMDNFHRRVGILRKYFSQVVYFPSLDKIQGNYPGFFDRFIFCKK